MTHVVTLLVPRAFPIACGYPVGRALRAGHENQTGAKLESRSIKEPVYSLIYDQLTEMQFLYDVKVIRHALIQYPYSGGKNGSC